MVVRQPSDDEAPQQTLANFMCKINPVDPGMIPDVIRYFDSTKDVRHDSHRYKVARAYEVETCMTQGFRHLDGTPKRLFHGSRNGNILSILLGGLIVPPKSSGIAITGRMFGDGIYGADRSTKALNYSTGFWGGNNKSSQAFLFVVEFSMGKVYMAKRALQSGVPAGYESIFAEGGYDLRNNEYIVPSTRQCRITHLLEVEK